MKTQSTVPKTNSLTQEILAKIDTIQPSMEKTFDKLLIENFRDFRPARGHCLALSVTNLLT